MSTKLRRWAVWTGGTILVLGGIGYMVQRRLSSAQIVEISREEVRAVTGEDLKWAPPAPSKPVLDVSEIDKLTAGKLKWLNLGRSNADVLKAAPEIDKTWAVTDAVQKLIRGKQPKNAVIDRRFSDALFTSRGETYMAYRAQFSLCIARGDRRKAVEVFRNSANLYEFMRPQYNTAIFMVTLSRTAIRSGGFSEAELRSMITAMKPQTGGDTSIELELKYEYNCIGELLRTLSKEEITDLVRESASSKTVLVGQLDKPRTLAELASLYREALHNCALPRSQRKWPVMTAYKARFDKIPQVLVTPSADPPWEVWWAEAQYRWRMASVPNVLGLIFEHSLFYDDGPKTTLDSQTFELMRWEQSRQVLMLLVYRKVHGNYPASLADLRSLNFQGTMPTDLYSNAPFRYDAKRNIVWSVGENGKDDGGTSKGSSKMADDIVFRLP